MFDIVSKRTVNMTEPNELQLSLNSSTPQQPIVSAFKKTVTVTPEYAAILLKNNKGNRHCSQAKVREYADMMLRNAWVSLPTSRAITFNKNENLIDGQQRLNAIILSGIPQEMDIWQINTDDKAVGLPFDRGRLRTVSDVTGVSPIVVSMLNMLRVAITSTHAKLTPDQILKCISTLTSEEKDVLFCVANEQYKYKAAIKAAVFFWYIETREKDYACNVSKRVPNDCFDDIKIQLIQRKVFSDTGTGTVNRQLQFYRTYFILNEGKLPSGQSFNKKKEAVCENLKAWLKDRI